MTRRDWTVIASVNLAVIASHAAWLPLWPGPARMAIVMAAMCLAPGAAWDWVWPRRSRALGAVVSRLLVSSTVAVVLGLAGFRLAGVMPAQSTMWLLMAGVCNAGLLAAWLGRRRLAWPRCLTRRELTLALIVMAGALVSGHMMATRVVPPFPDHDLDLQGTGYALVAQLTPRVLNDRALLYYFAHPPVLHVYVAASFLYQGQIDALRVYDSLTMGASGPGDTAALAAIAGEFVRDPKLRETRTPNVGFAAGTAALLLIWVFRRSRRWWLSALIVFAYLSNPEVIVRSAYGGYFALSTLAAVLMVMSACGPRRAGAGTGVWAALVDHKLIVALAGVVIGWMAAARGVRDGVRRGSVLMGGFVAGTALFWWYGLAIAPMDFVSDHLRHHLWERLAHQNSLGYGGYPPVVALWREFLAHTGVILLPAALALAALDLSRPAERPTRPTPLPWLLLGWIAVTAVVFSVIDWRMTKHLMPMVIAMHVLLAPARHAPRWRVAAAALVCVWLVAWNMPAVAGLVRDFAGFVVSPAW